MGKLKQTNVIILASTFPRWANDSVPGFVLDFANHIMPSVRSVTAIVPHYAGANRKDELPGGIMVQRFRYAYPYNFENIAYGQFQKTHFYPIKVLLYTISEFWTTLLVGIKKRPAIINAHWLIPQGFVAALVAPLVGAKVIVSVHGADIFTLNGKYIRKVKRFVLKHANAVVVNSSVTQAECEKLWPVRDYPIIPMGIDTERFKPGKPQKHDGYAILFVGRLAPSKGVMYLCEAARELHRAHKDIHLNIIGDGPERPKLEAYIKQHKLGNVISLLGWIQSEELPNNYRAADVFVGPSVESDAGRKEALGLVFAEASATGLPVITTDAGGMKDIVKDKITGLIVPQKNVDALRNALEYLYTHQAEAKKMGAAGSKFVRANFSWNSVTDRYLKLMQNL